MALLKKIIIASLPFLLYGCREDIEPLIDTRPVLCLNSLITAGKPIEVSVTRTWVYTDSKGGNDHSVSDAKVSIYANGNLVSDDYLAQEGDIIRIEAYSNTYGSAWAEVTVPLATPISNVKYTPTLKDLWYNDREEWGVSLDLTFDISTTLSIPNDPQANLFYDLDFTTFSPANEKDSDSTDYYDAHGELLRWYTQPSEVHFYGGSFILRDPFFSEYVGAFDDMMDWADIYASFFSNHQFKGTTQDIHVDFQDCSFRITQWDRNPELLECGYVFTLYSISESYCKWLNYRWQSDQSLMEEIIDIGLAEPMWGYSNVSTGAGVVAARSSRTVSINIKDFLLHTLTDTTR